MDGGERAAAAGPPLAAGPAAESRGTGGAAEGRAGASRAHRDPTSTEQRQVIRWERFLPRRSLRVLLVEHDDSTRHIVTALLRKCSYHVAAVADGLKAWEVLKEKHYNFDLVLTEVEMPSLSGIGLLSKIMGSELSKNTPVIMMSSHDSVGVVFKCMQKGAVDFLVKPVRKNELRNLWQHVWRKHCSASYANGPDNLNNNQSRSEDMSDNNAGSNHVSGNAGNESRTEESCEKGSDNQSSGSKPVTEIGSLQNSGEPLPAEHSSPRVMEAKLEKRDSNSALLANASRMHACGEAENKSVGIEVDVTLSIQETTISEKSQEQDHFYDRSSSREKDLHFSGCKESDKVDPGSSCHNVTPSEPPKVVIDFIGSVANGQCRYAISENGGQNENDLFESTKYSHVNNTHGFDSSPSWELSLKPQLDGCVKQAFQERHMLNHSASSAFSRYGHTTVGLSCQKSGSSPGNLCIRTRKDDEKRQSHLSSHGADNEKNPSFSPDGRLMLSQQNEEVINYHQVSSSSKNEGTDPYAAGPSREGACVSHSFKDNLVFPHAQLGLMSLPIPVGTIPFQSFCSGYGAMLQPIFYPEPLLPLHGSAAVEKAKDLSLNQLGQQSSHLTDGPQSSKSYHGEKNYHACHLEQGKKDEPDDIEPRDRRALICSYMEQTDQSVSCSRDVLNACGSNGSGESTDVCMNSGTAMESGNESGSQKYNRKGLDHDQFRREAALIKFRLKRKDRCFEKKVRYHSRKKLAEQRPRIKGQFVRQAAVDSTMMASEADD